MPAQISSFAGSASAVALPYSFSLLCNVFRLMPRISAARVLLLLVASRVFRINIFSASPTVVPTPSCTASGSWTPVADWLAKAGRQVPGLDHSAVANNHRSLQRIAQFADVARPCVVLNIFITASLTVGDLAAVLGAHFRDQKPAPGQECPLCAREAAACEC